MAARAALILSGAGVCFAFGFVRRCGSGGDIAFEVHLPSRFYRRVCLRFTPALALLSPRLPLAPRPALAVLSPRLPSVHACSFSFVRKKETACGVLRFYSAGRDRLRAFSQCRCSYLPLWVHFGVWMFFLWRSRRVTGVRRTGIRGQRRGLCAFLRKHIGLVMLSAGSTLGLRAPNLRQRSSTLWTLLRGRPSEKVRFTRRGCVGAYTRRRHPGTRKDPPNSNLWFGGSGCIAIISTRTIGDLA